MRRITRRTLSSIFELGTLLLLWLLAVALLLDHILRLRILQLDAETLVLLGIMLVLSQFRRIRKFRFPGFEAEIAPEEVAEVTAKVTPELPAMDQGESSVATDLMDFVREDPQLGLAKLRIDLEETLRRIYRTARPPGHHRQPTGIARLTEVLAKTGVIPLRLATGLRDVVPLANRAVHGEYIRQEDAERVADLGVRLLGELREIYLETLVTPVETSPLTEAEVARYTQALYRVSTVLPLANGPKMNVYLLAQDDLDQFLSGYEDYAEFLVDIEILGGRLHDEPK